MKISKAILKAGLVVAGSVAASSAWAANLTDGQIAEIMKTANDGEISAAQVAITKSGNKDVKDFAEHMIKEHGENLKTDKSVAKKEKLKEEASDKSKTLKSDANAKVADLKKLKGADFDKAYIDSQVTMHEQLLQELNQTLIPETQNADLKAYLESTKTHVEQHLAKAQEIQAKLKK